MKCKFDKFVRTDRGFVRKIGMTHQAACLIGIYPDSRHPSSFDYEQSTQATGHVVLHPPGLAMAFGAAQE